MRSLSIILSCLITALSFSQADEYINIGIPQGSSQIMGVNIDANGNHVFLVGRSPNMLLLVSTDANQNMNWSMKLSENNAVPIGKGVVRLTNGNFVAFHGGVYGGVSRKVCLICVNPQGQVVWNKELENGAQNIMEICPLPNGGVAVVGTFQLSSKSSVMALKSDGTLDWIKRIENSGGAAYTHDMMVTADMHLMTVTVLPSDNNLVKWLFTKWDLNGNVVWDKVYVNAAAQGTVEQYTSITQTNTGDFYIAGNIGQQIGSGTKEIAIRHFDSNLNYKAGRTYGFDYDDMAYCILADDEDNLLVSAFSMPALNCSGVAIIMRLDRNLDTIFVKSSGVVGSGLILRGNIYREGSLFYTTANGPYQASIATNLSEAHILKSNHDWNLVCGINEYNFDTGELPPFVLTTYDSSYISVPMTLSDFTHLGTASIATHLYCSNPWPDANIEEESSNTLKIYPIPASSIIQIDGTVNYESYELIGLHGRIVDKSAFASTGNMQIDVSSLEDGYYFLMLHNSEGTTQRKVLIQH